MASETTAECPDCGVEMRTANDGASRCPYCNSWAFRDAVSDGAIYAAASKTTKYRRDWYRICGERVDMSGRMCGRCEYFDLGGMDAGGESDCLNRRSPRFQTHATQTCINWVEGT